HALRNPRAFATLRAGTGHSSGRHKDMPMQAPRRLAAAVLMTAIATTMNAHADLPKDNPFASPSTLPYQLPPLDRIRDEHYVPALEFAMAEHRAQVERIAADKTAPTFDN